MAKPTQNVNVPPAEVEFENDSLENPLAKLMEEPTQTQTITALPTEPKAGDPGYYSGPFKSAEVSS